MPISTVVTSMKDEAPYILEWVAYHRALGFDRVVVLANDCTDGTHEMLLRLHEIGAVSYYENEVPVGAKPHSRALKIANQTPEVKSADFVMVLDADEFLVVKQAPHTLDVLLDVMNDRSAGMMVIPWRMFGSSHNMQFEDRPVIERFTQSMDASNLPKVGVKSLFRQADKLRLAIHFPKNVMKGGEPVGTPVEQVWIDAGGQLLKHQELTWNGGRQTIHRDLAEVAHFMIKSLDEYLLKIFRGDGLMNSSRHGIDYWRGADHNQVSDLVVADNVSGFEQERDRLFADPMLAELHKKSVAARFERLEAILANPDVQQLRGILQKSTTGTLQEEDVLRSRELVKQMSPKIRTDKLIEGDIPHSSLLSVTNAGLADAAGISWRMFKQARENSAMFWPEKKFGSRPVTNLVEGLKRAQKKGRAAGLGVRWFHNYLRSTPKEEWPLDEEILVVLTRDDDQIIEGYPTYIAQTKEKFVQKSQKGLPPLRELLTGTESAQDVEALIDAGRMEDPRLRVKRYLEAHPEAIVLNLDHPDAVADALRKIEGRGPSGPVAARLLRQSLAMDLPEPGAGQVPERNIDAPALASALEDLPEISENVGNQAKPVDRKTALGQPSLPMYWFKRGKGSTTGNFGDELGPLLVSHILGRPVEWSEPENCEIAAIGSILSQVSKSAKRARRTHPLKIWGSGLIEEDVSELDACIMPLAVRGQKTRDALSLLADIPMGDPGILANILVDPLPKSHLWGVVPHFTHRKSKNILEVSKMNGCRLIDPTASALDVLPAISSCQAIVSSSLHGLIVADSFGIPCCWLDIKSHKSHDYKFADYCSGLGRDMFPRIGLDELQSLTAAPPDLPAFAVPTAVRDRLVLVLEDAFQD